MKKAITSFCIIISAIAFIVYYLLESNSLYIPFFFLLSQSILGILLINYKNGSFYLQDIRILFLITFSLYSIFWPFVSLVGLTSYISTMPITTFIFATGLLGFNIGNIVLTTTWEQISIEKKIINYSTLLLILFFEICFATFYLIKNDIPIFTSLGSFDRSIFFERINQVWIITTITISLTSCLIIYYSDQSKKNQHLIGFVLILFYVALQISMGNRRDFLPIILFATLYYLIKKQSRMNVKIFLLGTAIFIGSFWLAQKRNSSESGLQGEEAITTALAANEFVFPMQTLAYVIHDNWHLRYGETYFLLPIQLLIPRVIYQNKPDDLGTEFVDKTFGVGWQGYAYSPVTEAYLNFGIIGPALFFFLFSILLTYLIQWFKWNIITFFYYIFYSLMFDFCRGSFSTIVYQLFIIIIGFYLINYLIKIKFKLTL